MMIRHRAAALSIAGMLALSLASAALAADSSVTQAVIAADRTALLDDLTLSAVAYSHAEQTSPGTMVLSVEDATGTDEGWNVTIESSDLGYTGDHNGENIPASQFTLTEASSPVVVFGDETAAPKVPGELEANVPLDVARKILHADTGSGQGSYTQHLGVELSIPASSPVGTYTGTLTTTITAGP